MSWSLLHYHGSEFAVNQNKPVCIVLSGWGIKTDIFEMALSGLSACFDLYLADVQSYKSFDDITGMAHELDALISAKIQSPYWLMGWSMGGNVAIEISKLSPQNIAGLLLMGVNPSFIAREQWPFGIDKKHFDALYALTKEDAEGAIKKFDRLQSLGDQKQKKLIMALSDYRHHSEKYTANELLQGLDILREVEQYQQIKAISVPVLWLLGEKDALVSPESAESIRALNTRISVQLIDESSHLPFLTQPEQFFHQIKHFLDTQSYEQEKFKMASRFSNAAETYDDFSGLQKIVGDKLINKLKLDTYQRLLDAGCGTGYWTEKLGFLTQYLVGIDLADGMLKYSREHHQNVSAWLRGDIEHLPFADQSFDAIYSNLAVQWSYKLELLLQDWYRVLPEGGEVFISTLGPGTLHELKTSFQSIDDFEHVNPFLSLAAIKQAIERTAFDTVSIEHNHETIKYAEPMELMRDLKGIGASLVKQGGVKGLMSRKKLQMLTSAYEQYRREDGKIPATYEVIYLHLKK